MLSVWLGCALCVLAHNPDTSYARIKIEPERVEVRLTYDIFTLLKIVPLDDDQDGRLARSELARHLPRIQSFLADHVWLEVGLEGAGLGEPDGFVWPPDTGDSIPQSEFHAATGLIHFLFVRDVSEFPEDVAVTFDLFAAFEDRHTVLGVFESAGQEHEVTFSQFEPDYVFDTGTTPPLFPRLLRFAKLGVEHIFVGYDHICFLIALVVVSRFRELVAIVTSFTVAHSITLILAALNVVAIPTRLIESGIALTIVYVALENLWVSDTSHRWMLAFGFGLIHGFGFANVLGETGLPTTGLVRCLVSFNVGVELGQLAIALVLLPLALALARWRHGRKVAIGLSCVLAAFGAAWFVDRALAWEFMPF